MKPEASLQVQGLILGRRAAAITATIQVFSRELTGDKVSIWHLSLLHVISHFPRPQDDTSSVNIYLKPFLKRIFKFGSGIQGLSLVYP